MDLATLMAAIELAPEIQTALQAFHIKDYEKYQRLFINSADFFTEVNQTSDPPWLLLNLYLRFAVECYPEYQKKYSTDLYFANFRDIALWSYDYYQKTGNKIGVAGGIHDFKNRSN